MGCEPHGLLLFAQPSLNLRSSFAEGSVGTFLNFELGTSCKLAPARVRAAQAEMWIGGLGECDGL